MATKKKIDIGIRFDRRGRLDKNGRVPVTERALLQRINRKLAADHVGVQMSWLTVKKTRGESARPQLGSFYMLDIRRNFVADTHVDLGELARKLDVLHQWEKFEE